MTTVTTESWVYYAPVTSGLSTVRHVLQDVVSSLLSLVLGYPAVGYGPFDADLISACWLLEIQCRPSHLQTDALKLKAQQLMDQLKAILGEPDQLPVASGPRYAVYHLGDGVRQGLIQLAQGGARG